MIVMAMALLAAAAGDGQGALAGRPGLPQPARAPVPAGDPGGWVTPEDYPKAALKAGEQGVTGFLLAVDSAGRVDTCSVTQSSGSLDLDQATCDLILARARFTPALNAQGQPILGTYRSRVKWLIPLKPAPHSGFLRTSFVVHVDGSVGDCQLHAEGAFEAEVHLPTPGTCPASMGFVTGYTDEHGQPVERRVTTTTRIEVEPLDAKPSLQPDRGEGEKSVTGRAP
jgi:periplasmic protein TonB